MKFGFLYRGALPVDCSAAPCQLDYQDTNFADRAGWKEIVVAAGGGIGLRGTSVPERDRSGPLSTDPTAVLTRPPQALPARLEFSSLAEAPAVVSHAPLSTKTSPSAPQHESPARGGAAMAAAALASPEARLDLPKVSGAQSSGAQASGSAVPANIELRPNQQGTPRNRFTELMAMKQMGPGIALIAAWIAAGLGALHALEPGHGKTIVAAYLVGSKGTARHALLLGLIVTASHTAGVYLLGGITLYAQKYIFPDRIYPFLGVPSGILIAGMGCYLFLQRYLGAEFTHSHRYENSGPANGTRTEESSDGRISARQLLVLGISGGIVPCPAALVVLLSAVAMRRTGFGLYLIVAFSMGLAAVLIAMGLATVYARRAMSRIPMEGPMVQRWLPMASAAMITVLGTAIAVRGLIAAGVLHVLARS